MAAKDSLHILPLSSLPLATPGLHRARLIKNAHFDGVVELFADVQTGSGQVAPQDLPRVFQFGADNLGDLSLLVNLSQSSSYDVYSLRGELRRLGVDVENVDDLRLSEAKAREVTPHMAAFTRPLVRAVFGSAGDEQSPGDLMQLFAAPDVETTQNNLAKLAQQVDIEIPAIPKFLQDYGDVYLSLAYYQSCLDASRPKLEAFLEALAELKKDRNLAQDRGVMAACREVQENVENVVEEVGDILAMFRDRTEDMWTDMSSDKFRRMEQMITDYQKKVGGALCFTSVKLDAWSERFPRPDVGGPRRRADFVMNTMRHGLERVQSIDD
ncbi:hypothetical protein [Pelagibius sp.]|uniref:hypothetical protein n=1 Tax=Pelagibius sp. TaxID=1931238 RepID=UPI00261199BC|nr:hypothetical protein [Pelagibius sp.]